MRKAETPGIASHTVYFRSSLFGHYSPIPRPCSRDAKRDPHPLRFASRLHGTRPHANVVRMSESCPSSWGIRIALTQRIDTIGILAFPRFSSLARESVSDLPEKAIPSIIPRQSILTIYPNMVLIRRRSSFTISFMTPGPSSFPGSTGTSCWRTPRTVSEATSCGTCSRDRPNGVEKPGIESSGDS